MTKNISFDEKRGKYLLQVTRQNRIFREAFESLDEAIVTKDKVLSFYNENDRLPSRSEIGLKESYGENDGLYEVVQTESVETCVRCKEKVICRNYKFRSDFKHRGRLCTCCLHDTRKRKTWSSTNILNVSYEKKKEFRRLQSCNLSTR